MKNSQYIGEVKMTYRTTSHPMGKVLGSEDSYQFFRKIWDTGLIEYQEQFCVLFLSRSNHILGFEFLSTGGTAGTVVDPKLVFSAALLCNASSIILSHNHPSGNLNPSPQDETLTSRLIKAGKILDIEVLDHIIIGKENYMSFADRGILS